MRGFLFSKWCKITKTSPKPLLEGQLKAVAHLGN
jgi:hypothetical protein